MTHHIFRAISEPFRPLLSWEETWKGKDDGLIACWERGRELAAKEPELATRALADELPVLAWKGGVEKKLKGKKYGTIKYLAQWQGLRGNDLDIHLDSEVVLVCSRTGMAVTFTAELAKFAGA